MEETVKIISLVTRKNQHVIKPKRERRVQIFVFVSQIIKFVPILSSPRTVILMFSRYNSKSKKKKCFLYINFRFLRNRNINLLLDLSHVLLLEKTPT